MQQLTRKYRPTQIEDLVLPQEHCVGAALQFLERPYASGWLLHGRSGLGKTSLARLMGAAASHPLSTFPMVGADLTVDVVRDIARTFGQRPLYGKYHGLIVDEADSIPKLAQVRLLGLLDNLEFAVVVCTSNDDLHAFEDRFLSRVKTQLFTSQGLSQPAVAWLLKIASMEGIPLQENQAARIVKDAKNNLRAVLQAVEVLGKKRLEISRESGLPMITDVKNEVQTVRKVSAICPQTA